MYGDTESKKMQVLAWLYVNTVVHSLAIYNIHDMHLGNILSKRHAALWDFETTSVFSQSSSHPSILVCLDVRVFSFAFHFL
jgi:hypothetical protein